MLAGAVAEGGGGDGGDESGLGLLATSTSGTGSSHLGWSSATSSGPPSDPVAGGEKRYAWSRIAPWTEPEGIKSSPRYRAPPGILDAPGPGSANATSIRVNPEQEPGPFGGPYPRSAAGRS